MSSANFPLANLGIKLLWLFVLNPDIATPPYTTHTLRRCFSITVLFRAVLFILKPLLRPAGVSVWQKTHRWAYFCSSIQCLISWTVRREKWRGLSALHPSKCLMNHLSSSPSLPPAAAASPAPTHHPLFFTSSLFVYLSLPAGHQTLQSCTGSQFDLNVIPSQKNKDDEGSSASHFPSELSLPMAQIQTLSNLHLFSVNLPLHACDIAVCGVLLW